jgi:outer membrane protein OmpA-like peptidoglycan-associated protein
MMPASLPMAVVLLAAQSRAEEAAGVATLVPDVPVDGQVYRPPADGSGLLWADVSEVREGAGARAVFGWVHEPVVWVWDDSGERVPLVDNAVGVNVIGSFGYWRIRGAVDVPLYVYAAGAAGSGPGLGDLGIDLKGQILDGGEAPVGLALDVRIDAPTGSTTVPLSPAGLGWEAAVVADTRLGPVLLAANLGTHGTPAVDAESVSLSNQLAARVGAGFDPGGNWGLSADLALYAEWSDLGNPAGAPAEALVGGWFRPVDAFRLSAGVGHGLGNGIGASNGRVVLGVSWEPATAAKKPEAVVSNTPAKTPEKGTEKATEKPAEKPTSTAAKTTTPSSTPSTTPAPPTAPTTPPVVVAPTVKVVPVPTAREPVVVSSNHLLLYQRVSFDGASLRDEGARQLDAIVRYLANHPEIETVRIEGHTDGRGDPSDELALSGTRAGIALEYLVKKGVARERFYAAGYGGMRPLVQGVDENARVANERIDFVVTKWAEGHEPQ